MIEQKKQKEESMMGSYYVLQSSMCDVYKQGRFFPSGLFLFLMKGADGRDVCKKQEGIFRC